MNAGSEPLLPSWGWWALATALVGGVGGAAWFMSRAIGWDAAVRKTGAPEELVMLARVQRFTESRGNWRRGLGRPERFPSWAEPRDAPQAQAVAESKAAEMAYDRNVRAYSESPYPRSMWIFGSGGAYGLLPGNALGPWRGTEALARGAVSPYDVFNKWRSTVFFVDYVYRLTQKAAFRELPVQEQTLLALKRGLASPRLVGDYEEVNPRSRTSRRNSLNALRALGLSEDVLNRQMPLVWPGYPGATELVP